MTTKTAHSDPDTPSVTSQKLDRLSANLERIEELSSRLMQAIRNRKPTPPTLQGPGQELYIKAVAAYMSEMMNNPSKIIERQVKYWGDSLKFYVEAQQNMLKGKVEHSDQDRSQDRRFASEIWDTNPFYHYIKQQYLASAQSFTQILSDLDTLDETERERVQFFAKQMMDMMAPTNFLATNPDALQHALETDGASLVQGLENLVRDLEDHDGEFQVELADKTAFTVGENIATTPGKVVLRTGLFELIQYAPTTPQVYTTPLLVFPPWINKFYIMDLKPKNSLIKWIVDQGYTVFVVSWVNPDAAHAQTGIETYIHDGYLTAIEAVKSITGQKKVNAVGYCIAGTVLSLALAMLAKRGDTSVSSASFFTTLLDFTHPGEMGVFLDDDFVGGIEAHVAQEGYLHSRFMSRTFSYLRANDLVYGPAIRSYMMGQASPAFDLLYWNDDSTNLPGRFITEYLRHLCQANEFAKGQFKLSGETLSAADVTLPICAIACESDHIAPWTSSYEGMQKLGARDKTFIVSQSGHVAGIINPVSKNKYGHFVNADMSGSHGDWMAGADCHNGSWWPRWGAWLAKKSGKMIAARPIGAPAFPALCDAPGTYVLQSHK